MADLSLFTRLAAIEHKLGSELLLARLEALEEEAEPSAPPARPRAGGRRGDGRGWGTPYRQEKRGQAGWGLRPVLPDGSRPRCWGSTLPNLWADVEKRTQAIGRAVEDMPKDYDELCEKLLAVYTGLESSKKAVTYNLNASRREFGKRDPALITRFEIQEWLKKLATVPSAATGRLLRTQTQHNYLGALDRALQFGLDNEWLPRNRASGLSVAVEEPDPVPFESWQEVFEVAEAFRRIGWPVGSEITRCAAGLALRLQEVLVARVCDVDLAAGTFHVQRCWDDTLRCEVERTKTPGSTAILNLTLIASDALAGTPDALNRDPEQWRASPLLFTHDDGSVISPDYFLGKWREAMKLLPHLAYRPPKNLRHTFATLTLLELGVDKIKIVADLLRHDSYRTTERYYIKKVQEMRRRAAAAASNGMPSFSDFSR